MILVSIVMLLCCVCVCVCVHFDHLNRPQMNLTPVSLVYLWNQFCGCNVPVNFFLSFYCWVSVSNLKQKASVKYGRLNSFSLSLWCLCYSILSSENKWARKWVISYSATSCRASVQIIIYNCRIKYQTTRATTREKATWPRNQNNG